MEIRVGDYGYDLTFSVKNPDGSAKSLAGVQGVTFLVAEVDTFRTIVEGTCQITDAVNGKVKYTVQTDDFKKAGNYIGGLKLTYADKVITTDDITVVAKHALDSW